MLQNQIFRFSFILACTLNLIQAAFPADWQNTLGKYSIPHAHGSGVKVDLGGLIDFKITPSETRQYRHANGKCPVPGKVLVLGTGASFLQVAGTGDPPSGGLGRMIGSNEEGESYFDTESWNEYPNLTSAQKCIKWAQDSGTIDADNPPNILHPPTVFDEETSRCYHLITHLQRLQGDLYCDNDGGGALLFCISPIKSLDLNYLMYMNANNSLDYQDDCGLQPIAGAAFGTLTGNNQCVPMAPLKTLRVSTWQACAQKVFDNSSDDSPEEIDGQKARQSYENVSTQGGGTPPPSGDVNRLNSYGWGANYGLFNPALGCEIYRAIPECIYPSSGSTAVTSLTSTFVAPILPDCSKEFEGAVADEQYSCSATTFKRCESGQWNEVSESTWCPYFLGPIFGGVWIILVVLSAILLRRKAPLQIDESKEGGFEGGTDARPEDRMVEADQSDWGESDDHTTDVIVHSEDSQEQTESYTEGSDRSDRTPSNDR